MHPYLIQANIALFEGNRAEVRRLLDAYCAEVGGGEINTETAGMIRWLEAHSQDRLEQRIEQLRILETMPNAGSYARLANQYLADEDHYQSQLNIKPKVEQSRWMFMGVPAWKIGVFGLVGALTAMVILSFITAGSGQRIQTAADVDNTLNESPAESTLNLPDKSQPLLMDSHRASYPDGILQIAALEDFSERVVSNESSTPVNPVNGAKFYALRVMFECRTAICNAPPEAALNLQIGDEMLVPVRDDLFISGESTLEPIALGRSTAGWIVFEIPANARVDALVIQSRDQRNPFDPVSIDLAQTEG